MKDYSHQSIAVIFEHAKEIIGIPLGQIDLTGRLKTGKGGIGTTIEKDWFGYNPNNNAEPDFPEAKVELKVTPFIRHQHEISAKERLVCTIINYMTEYHKDFYESDFWKKAENMLLMFYEHKKEIPKEKLKIEKVVIFNFPEDDLLIIKEDWKKIIKKIRDGQAHLLTEGDTLYLAACTKGETAAKSLRKQPCSTVLAKQRAYSLKTSYMTKILRKYVFGQEEDEHIIKDVHELVHDTFEDCIIKRLSPFYGYSQSQLIQLLNIENSKAKNINEIILARILQVKGRISNTYEFHHAHIIPKTVRVQQSGHVKENMSFPTFKFLEIIKEKWEDSTLKNYLEPAKFMFVIFQEDLDNEYRLKNVFFWNIPWEDLEEVHKVWEQTVRTIKEGVQLYNNGFRIENNLPKKSSNSVAHVRPHGVNSKDTYPLPNGQEMPKQCFWLNNTYIEKIIHQNTIHHYQCTKEKILTAAEQGNEYRID